MLYGTITEFCTPQDCPVMSAGPKYEYHWKNESQKKPARVSAPVYVDNLMTWVQTQLDDEAIFPRKIGELALPVVPRGSLCSLGTNSMGCMKH
jgi:MOB kinase activator 1